MTILMEWLISSEDQDWRLLLSTLIVRYKSCGNGCVLGLQVCGLRLEGCGLGLGLGGCGLVNITGASTVLVGYFSMITFSWRCNQFFKGIISIWWKPYLAVLKNRILLKILDPHPDADEFHNLTSFSLSTDFYTDPISSFHVAYRQTDRQTDR